MAEVRSRARLGRRGRPILYAAAAILPLLGGVTPRELGPIEPTRVAEGPLTERIDLWRRGAAAAGVVVVDSLLAARIDEIRATAPSFAAAWDELLRSGIPVLIGTREELAEVLPANVRASNAWAGIAVTWGESRALDRAAVAIRVEWIQQLHRDYATPGSGSTDAIDGLLIHEIYGHLIPVVQARDARKQCSDPREGQRLAESCVGRRELAIKAERARLLALDAE